jgi:orotidine-5'-phosphate decarboxylase
MPSFAERFLDLAAKRSPLCVGIDPSIELLAQWGLPASAAGVGTFCDVMVEAMGGRVAIVKPQAAFFEQFGPDGMQQLARLVRNVQARGALALIDVKRGDIGHTLDAYADAMIGPDSPFGGDAMTVTAYMGFGSLKPLLDKAVARSCGVFVVVRSSNPDGQSQRRWPTVSPPTTMRSVPASGRSAQSWARPWKGPPRRPWRICRMPCCLHPASARRAPLSTICRAISGGPPSARFRPFPAVFWAKARPSRH